MAKTDLDVAYLVLEVFQLLLYSSILLCHLLVFSLPLVSVVLKCLHFAFEMTSLDICLSEPAR